MKRTKETPRRCVHRAKVGDTQEKDERKLKIVSSRDAYLATKNKIFKILCIYILSKNLLAFLIIMNSLQNLAFQMQAWYTLGNMERENEALFKLQKKQYNFIDRV